MSVWLSNGEIVMDNGQIVICDECPCTGTGTIPECAGCFDDPPYTMSALFTGYGTGQCNCTSINGVTFGVDYRETTTGANTIQCRWYSEYIISSCLTIGIRILVTQTYLFPGYTTQMECMLTLTGGSTFGTDSIVYRNFFPWNVQNIDCNATRTLPYYTYSTSLSPYRCGPTPNPGYTSTTCTIN